ncbi:MAG: hypothetical protein OQK32_02230 [Gammaproteobacteria bacterium]|nr:hypothetical protein [Gammaproteobacteria bacterium]
MNIFMQKAVRKSDLSARKVQAGLVGQAVDERGNAAVNFVKELVGEENTYVVCYDPEELKVFVDGCEKDIEEFSDFVSGFAND